MVLLLGPMILLPVRAINCRHICILTLVLQTQAKMMHMVLHVLESYWAQGTMQSAVLELHSEVLFRSNILDWLTIYS